ncbi:MAG TPA: beta-N-acetylhexosaminidase [Actinocrinis sp.]|nr:beta-N-acetylhexosaminidase [Actinocrinis sp.]
MAAQIVPEPVLVKPSAGVSYTITSGTAVLTQPGSAAAAQVGGYLAGLLRPSTGYALPVRSAPEPDAGGSGSAADSGISLLLAGAPATVGAQGYELDVTSTGVTIRAQQPAGLFAGVQTLRQLLPAASARTTVQPGPWPVPGGHVLDYPRYAYRGAMLDVARHFFSVADVERYIDEISLYKVDYLHLHLSDDQGWRIAINGWPQLTTVGGATGADGSPGGYFTQADYKAIVAYAQSRYVTIVPEIDMPSHVEAALAAYPQLGCLATAPPVQTSTGGTASTLCDGAPTKQFVSDVISQLVALTPGPYLQIGGDEAAKTPPATYSAVIGQAQDDVLAAGKTPIGWDAIADAPLDAKTVLEYWHLPSQPADQNYFAATAKGQPVILAPADHAYLDQMYVPGLPLGLHWAGYVEVRNAYDWDPTTVVPGLKANAVTGVEAPLWTETLSTMSDLEYMAFPRLPAIAEIGWSPQSTHDWVGFSVRLGAQAPLWAALGINYYKSIQVPWEQSR